MTALYEDVCDSFHKLYENEKDDMKIKFKIYLVVEADPASKMVVERERQLARYLTLDESGEFFVLNTHVEVYIEGSAGELEDEFFNNLIIDNKNNDDNEIGNDINDGGNIDAGAEIGNNSNSISSIQVLSQQQPGVVLPPPVLNYASSVPGSPSACSINELPLYDNEITKRISDRKEFVSTEKEFVSTEKEFKGHHYLERCHLHDHRGFCGKVCRYAHICNNYVKGICNSICPLIHPCNNANCMLKTCGKVHVKPVQNCKFEEKTRCLSDACIMNHITLTSSKSEATNRHTVKICEFFNKKSGCLSQRTSTFICSFLHICDICSDSDHGRLQCPKFITTM